MTIGEALKKERIKMGLTQDEMIQGVIQKSHYSKVERNIEKISADSLFRILFLHHIDVDVFLGQIKDEYCTDERKKSEELEAKMMEAFNNSRDNEVEKYLQSILNLPDNKSFKYRTFVAVAYFRDELNQISSEFKTEIIDQFIKYDSWLENTDSLRILANCMQIFPIDQLDECIRQLLRHYCGDSTTFSEIMLERVAIICNNYLHYCYYSQISGNNIKRCLEYLKSLDNRTHFMFYKIAQNFYQSLYAGEKMEAKRIKNQLISWGYESRVASWKV